jgi:hypothetical protein
MTDLSNPNLTALQRRDNAHHAIETERDFQDRTYPEASTLYTYGKLCQKYTDRIMSPDFTGDVRAEFRKLAATAKRCLEVHGVIKRTEAPEAVIISDDDVARRNGERVDAMIVKEIEGQDKMWGVANERADSQNGQLLGAALAQAVAVLYRRQGTDNAFDLQHYYPSDWSGFRSYGGDIPNLVVAAAFIRQEIKRLIAAGEDPTRLSRDRVAQPYTKDQPAQPFPVDDKPAA